MKAAIFKKSLYELEITDIAKPDLINNGAIIKIHGCGLCSSDIIKIKKHLISDNTVLGHEVIGKITEINFKNIENKNFKVGDKVAIGHHVPCYQCVYCKNQSYSMCKNFKESNIVPGGFSEYIYVSEAHLKNTVFKIPDNLSDMEASFVEPSACCLRAVKRANVKPGDKVLVIGLGSIGQIIGQIAKYYGAETNGYDLITERLELAKELGFDNVYKVNKDASKYNDIGADKVFLASGSPSSLELALASVRDGGMIIVFASLSSDNGAFLNNDIYYRELTVMGSYSPSPPDLCEALNLIKNSKIKVNRFAKEYSLENINKAIKDTLENKIIKAYIKL
ncbi:MAG: alcohol dehydrogenase catalytic domain-containing protein [bacterium]